MIKDISILLVGVENTILNGHIEVDEASSLTDAKLMIKTKFYDAVVAKFNLDGEKGANITQIYPHYRSIIFINNDQELEELKKYRNGFYSVTTDLSGIELTVMEIVNKYPKKEQDTLMALLNIQGSIEELTSSHSFIKTSFNSIHSKLKALEEKQEQLNNSFSTFKDQRIKAEQFYIDTMVDMKDRYDRE